MLFRFGHGNLGIFQLHSPFDYFWPLVPRDSLVLTTFNHFRPHDRPKWLAVKGFFWSHVWKTLFGWCGTGACGVTRAKAQSVVFTKKILLLLNALAGHEPPVVWRKVCEIAFRKKSKSQPTERNGPLHSKLLLNSYPASLKNSRVFRRFIWGALSRQPELMLL